MQTRGFKAGEKGVVRGQSRWNMHPLALSHGTWASSVTAGPGGRVNAPLRS